MNERRGDRDIFFVRHKHKASSKVEKAADSGFFKAAVIKESGGYFILCPFNLKKAFVRLFRKWLL